MSSENKNPDFFSEIKKSLDACADPGKLNQLSKIEVDLIRERLRALYDQLSGIGIREKEPDEIKTVEFEISGEKEVSPLLVDEKIQRSETDTAEIGSDELLSEQAASKDPAPKTARQKEQPDLFSLDDGNKKSQKKSVAEVISDDKKSESVADKLQKQSRVNSLKNAIGINEKFFFINELFEGNLNEYNAAIESLDKLQNLEECLNMLEQLSSEYKWQEQLEAVDQLKQFLERKFM